MTLRRRSRRLTSQKLEDFKACSSLDVGEVVNDEHDEGKQKEKMRMEILPKKGSNSHNSPVALRTRSRSRCSSMESNDAGIVGDSQKAVSIVLTPTKTKPCRKRTSLMPQLEEIVEEQQTCKDEDNNKNGLMGKKMETKKVSKKKGKLWGNKKEHVEVCAEKNFVEKSNKKDVEDTSMEDIAGEKEATKLQQKITETSWNKSGESPKKSFAKTLEKSLTRNPKKSHMENSDHFLEDSAKNSDCSLANIPGKSSTMILEKSSKKNREEMLASSLSSTINCLEQKAELVTVTNLEENSSNIWPKLDNLLSLWLKRDECLLVDSIEKAYAFVIEVDALVPTISEELITSNSETIWQQIAYGNKKFHRYFAKTKHFLDIEVSADKELAEKQDDPLPSVTTTSKFHDENSDDTKRDSNHFFMPVENEVKRLDKNLTGESGNKIDKNDDDNYSNMSNSEGIGCFKISDNASKKRWKSAVDDHFFSLAEMEEYLDKQEKDQAYLTENFFEHFDKDSDDLQNSQTNYHYADFYGNTNKIEEGSSSKAASNKLNRSKRILQSGELDNRKEKRVTFADEISNDLDYESDQDDSQEDNKESTVLLGQVDEEDSNETEFRRRQKKLQERIFSIEQTNLAPRNWDLSGEVTAIERGENTMLEKHLDFDQSAPCAPVITVDTTAQLESKIIQRIKDRAFDDVLRVERKSETNAAYRASVAESEIVKKSLAEVYEEQYQKTQYGVGNEEKTNEKHEEIKKLMSSLFQKLNALSHYRYIPSEVSSEVRVVSNMPSLQKEEVGPLASTDAVLLAPEEIHKHVTGPIKGDDEKTKTDRSHSRRKKKKWQHIKQFKKQEAELEAIKSEISAKKPKLMSQHKESNMKLTSASFFQRLQTKATEEMKSKKYKITKMNATKKKLSTNYKL
ncbi:Mpp10 family protein [Acanthocheilonema viteae]